MRGCTTATLVRLQGWTEGLKKYMDSLKTKDNINGKAYSSRYIGSLVRQSPIARSLRRYVP
jgi:fructose-1,6-bisphosphatase